MSGEIKYTSSCGACGPAVQAIASCTSEYGDEWDYDGHGSCDQCKFNCVSFGLLGTACTAGTKAKCKHISYLGEKTSCCLGNGPGIAKYTCNPSYTAANDECNSVYADYCATGDRIISDPKCVNWRNMQPAASQQILQNYCVQNVNNPSCREWCKSRADAGDGVCDVNVQKWCDEHPSEPYCSCVKSPLADPKFGINPKCNDRKCIDTGYITQNMRNTNCPDITNCDVQSKLLNSGVQLTGVTINQSCGKDAPPLIGDDTAPFGGVATTSNVSNTTIMVILFVLFVFIALIIGAVWYVVSYSGGSESGARRHDPIYKNLL
jgi:hypothetical protein